MTRRGRALPPPPDERPAAGGDLIIPVMAIAFTLYFLGTTWGLVWEAKANGVVIGTVLILLCLVQIGLLLRRIQGGYVLARVAPLLGGPVLAWRRLATVASLVLFILLLPYTGTTLGLILTALAIMLVLGARDFRMLVVLPLGIAAAVYLLFIAFLDSRLPHGPIEHLITALTGGGA
jgi:hypothetical protein